ncbi:DUF3299 domain-containing protein [Alteromonas sediminis]|uniref:DUF3299 domain-containing protein n=1 Tax=Alteromonas sediminis TaxID=2259342 RepID=A0A3N5Z608_9ALTE|nr:DUF3299 domain-containing protein [Alteromonas sediminis]RPJ65874.1 DUF3299 domain-containing protein [Alteromonas sediminis]
MAGILNKGLLLIFLVTAWVATYSTSARAETFQEVEWTALMPPEDLEILMDPPDFLLNIVDGSDADNLDALAERAESDEKARRFKEALKSDKVVSELDGKKIRIPGFVVPLETNEDRDVVAFFIVPYFGACLHLPPPPPNQILYASWPEGLTVEELSVPMWFEGTVKIETQENETGKSAYSIAIANVEPYVG